MGKAWAYSSQVISGGQKLMWGEGPNHKNNRLDHLFERFTMTSDVSVRG